MLFQTYKPKLLLRVLHPGTFTTSSVKLRKAIKASRGTFRRILQGLLRREAQQPR